MIQTTAAADDALLTTLDNKLQQVRDRVQGVAEGYSTGLYLFGEGGTGKSFTVEQKLRELHVPYKLTNSRVTAKGLFKLLKEFPDAVHIIEDAETLFSDKNAHGVLRSALWGQVGRSGEQERVVSWQTGAERDEFVFAGGLILLANAPLGDCPALRAVATRIPVMQYQATNPEVAALMRHIAGKGHHHGPYELSPEKCLEVAHEIVARSDKLKRNLDLRLLVNTFQDRLQYENGAAETHWKDLLDSRMKERIVATAGGQGVRAATKAKELEFLRQTAGLPQAERLEAWVKQMGKSKAAFYRRLGDLEHAVSHLSQLSHLPGEVQTAG